MSKPPACKLLQGRLDKHNNAQMLQFNASVGFDYQLAHYDIQGSIAHTTMLAEQSIISERESQQIISGLQAIDQQIQQGDFHWRVDLEDVHMNIENALIERIGEVGKKLHTARSRNDQVATDVRLYLRDQVETITRQLQQLQQLLLEQAERYHDYIMPGFTHLQMAQPVTYGHYLLAWFEMFQRDRMSLVDAQKRIDQMPLGSAALAGTSFPINRQRTAELLGFSGICQNSLDAVSDRDFALEFLAVASRLMIHLSRICEELIIWNSAPFDMIALPDAYCTGSSIMPQKKNPDIPELIRGKTARVVAAQQSLLVLMKAQPLAYNKDNQEDKEPLFDTVTTVQSCLQLFTAMLQQTQPKSEQMRHWAAQGYATATDLADYLVRKDIPFREAYQIVGAVVRFAIATQVPELAQLSLSQLQQIDARIGNDVFAAISLEASLQARNHLGGTAPQQVLAAIGRAKLRLKEALIKSAK